MAAQTNLDQYGNLCQSKLFFQQVSNSCYNYKTVYNIYTEICLKLVDQIRGM